MKFMILMIPGGNKAESGEMPDEQTLAAMMKYNEDLVNAGVMLGGDGLHPTAKGARVHFAGGKHTITDGPFTEAREILGGYWLWRCKSKQEALEWAARCPAGEGDTLEIRQVFDPEDFGPEIAAQEADLLARMQKTGDKKAD